VRLYPTTVPLGQVVEHEELLTFRKVDELQVVQEINVVQVTHGD